MSDTGGHDSGGPFENASYNEQFAQYGNSGHRQTARELPGVAGAVGAIAILLGLVLLFALGSLVVAIVIVLIGVALIAFGYRQERTRARRLIADSER